jgi:hypothetical protein
MTKRIFFLLGVLAGLLFAEVARRKQLERLHLLETQAAEKSVRYAEYAREWEAELAALPFERRMEYELFQAGLNLDNNEPDWEDGDEESD